VVRISELDDVCGLLAAAINITGKNAQKWRPVAKMAPLTLYLLPLCNKIVASRST